MRDHHGLCCLWVRGEWDLDALGKFFRRRRRRRPEIVAIFGEHFKNMGSGVHLNRKFDKPLEDMTSGPHLVPFTCFSRAASK